MERKQWTMREMVLLSAVLVLLLPALCFSQAYPTKPINVTLSVAPGDMLDTAVRSLAAPAEKLLGQPLILSNKAGGGGSVAPATVAKEKPDGYHLIAMHSSAITRVPQFRTVNYSKEDFVPIMQFGMPLTGIVVRANSPWKTLKDFVKYVKENPGKVTFCTTGAGGPPHLAMELVSKAEGGLNWEHIPYAGAMPCLTALLGGHVTAASTGSMWLPHVKQGLVRVLATDGENRLYSLPDVPTYKDLGYGFTGESAGMFAAPKGTPPAMIQKLGDVFHKAMDDPDFIKACKTIEYQILYRNQEDLKKYLDETYVRLGKLIQELKLPREDEEKK